MRAGLIDGIFVDLEHRGLLIGPERASIVSPWLADGFADFINEKKWLRSGSRLDWAGIGIVRIDLERAASEEIRSFLGASLIGRHDLIVAWFSEGVNALVGPPEFMLDNVDAIYLAHPGVRFLVGADRSDDGGALRLDFRDFAECIDSRLLTAEVPLDGGEV
jgi:hypothetical protein